MSLPWKILVIGQWIVISILFATNQNVTKFMVATNKTVAEHTRTLDTLVDTVGQLVVNDIASGK